MALTRLSNCRLRGSLALVAWVGLASTAGVSFADTIGLVDLNSQANIDTAAGGISLWGVDSATFADAQTLFYRVGSTGPQSTWQYAGSSAFTTDGSGTNGVLIRYQGTAPGGILGSLRLNEIVTLLGSQTGSGSSLISESFEVSNSSSSPVDLHLLQYNNLQLSGNGADSLQFLSPGDILQTSGLATPQVSAELVATGPITAYQADTAPTLLNAIQNDSPVVLTDARSASGNTESALDWEVPLGVGQSYNIGQQYSLTIVPEPSTLTLLAALAVFFALLRFRSLLARSLASPNPSAPRS